MPEIYTLWKHPTSKLQAFNNSTISTISVIKPMPWMILLASHWHITHIFNQLLITTLSFNSNVNALMWWKFHSCPSEFLTKKPVWIHFPYTYPVYQRIQSFRIAKRNIKQKYWQTKIFSQIFTLLNKTYWILSIHRKQKHEKSKKKKEKNRNIFIYSIHVCKYFPCSSSSSIAFLFSISSSVFDQFPSFYGEKRRIDRNKKDNNKIGMRFKT